MERKKSRECREGHTVRGKEREGKSFNCYDESPSSGYTVHPSIEMTREGKGGRIRMERNDWEIERFH